MLDQVQTKWKLVAPTFDDLEGVYEILAQNAIATIGKVDLTLQELENEWNTPNFDISRDVRLVKTDEGKVIGYVEVWDTSDPHIFPFIWGCTHPEYKSQGIATALMNWAEGRAAEAVEKAPPGARVAAGAGINSTNEDAAKMLQDRGFTPGRHFWRMVIELHDDLPAPQIPEGLRIVAMTPDQERAVHDAVDDAFKDHYGHVDHDPEESFERWLHRRQNDPLFDYDLQFLAMDGDEIAAIALCRPEETEDPDMAWLSILGVRRNWRKRGLGLALLHYVFNFFHEKGKQRVGLGVDAASLTGATRLYKRAGMHADRQWDNYEKELRPGKELRNM